MKEVSEALEPCLESGLADETDAGGLCSGVAGEGVVDTAPLAAVPVPAHISGSLRPAAQQPSPAADSECDSERVLNGISAQFMLLISYSSDLFRLRMLAHIYSTVT